MNTLRSQPLPFLYKGLALFTPGGDLIYCVDPSKQGHWHFQLCQALQTLLHLPEPPLFLVPCYTATLDRWLHPHTQQLQISAEVYPRVWRYRSVLNMLFDLSAEHWQIITTPHEICDSVVLNSYQQRFPQLWQHHNLVIRLDQLSTIPSPTNNTLLQRSVMEQLDQETETVQLDNTETDVPQGYVLRLFVAGHNPHTTSILENLHQLLDQVLDVPYTLKVIDVAKHPERAEADQIAATPTLIKVWPKPLRRLVGSQLETDTIIQLLDAMDLGTSTRET